MYYVGIVIKCTSQLIASQALLAFLLNIIAEPDLVPGPYPIRYKICRWRGDWIAYKAKLYKELGQYKVNLLDIVPT